MEGSIFDRPTVFARGPWTSGLRRPRAPPTSYSEFASMVRARGVQPSEWRDAVERAYREVHPCSVKARYEEAAAGAVRDIRLAQTASAKRLAGLGITPDQRRRRAEARLPRPVKEGRAGADAGDDEEDSRVDDEGAWDARTPRMD